MNLTPLVLGLVASPNHRKQLESGDGSKLNRINEYTCVKTTQYSSGNSIIYSYIYIANPLNTSYVSKPNRSEFRSEDLKHHKKVTCQIPASLNTHLYTLRLSLSYNQKLPAGPHLASVTQAQHKFVAYVVTTTKYVYNVMHG